MHQNTKCDDSRPNSFLLKSHNSVKKRSNVPKLELDLQLFKRKPYKKISGTSLHPGPKKVRKTKCEHQGE